MEISNKNSAFLSNYEVYKLLKETKEKEDLKYKANKTQQVDKHLPTIVYESLKYLEKSCCVQQSKPIIEEFYEKCKLYSLTKIEILQLLNQRPSSAVELQLIIEDSEERFTIEQMDDLLDLINNSLPQSSVSETPAN
jgi:hypothetical protein